MDSIPLWWGQLVTSPLRAQELSFEHLLEIARTHTDRQQANFLTKTRLWVPSSQSCNQPFSISLSLYTTAKSKQLPPSHRGRTRSDIWCVGPGISQLLGLDFVSDKAFPVDSRGAA